MALQDETNPSLYRLLDAPPTPDPYYTDDYTAQHKGSRTTIVIDNGSWQCRAGWANEEEPRLVFRNVIARTRGKKGEADTTLIGNDITNVEAMRSTLRSQFDHNLVTNFTLQEQIFDYCFSHLGLSGERKINHPVLITEPLCNPAYCRSHMTELLFEGYGVPAVTYGVDALFSAHHNLGVVEDAMIVSVGHQTVHLLPVLAGHPDLAHCKRVNVGGLHTASYLHRLLALKYPALQTHITLSRVQEVLSQHCSVSLDYPGDLRTWAAGKYQDGYKVIQLPFSQVNVPSAMDSVAKQQRDVQRRQRAREQLLRVNQRKKEEKIAEQTSRLTALTQQLEAQSTFDPEEYQLMLEDIGFTTVEELRKEVASVRGSVEAEQEKLASVVKSLSGGGGVAGGGVASGGVEEEEEVSEEWLDSLRERKKELLDTRRVRQLKKQDLGKRRSAASQKRMRIISLLGAEESNKKKSKQQKVGEDTFGMDDDDWNVYRTISKDADESTEEREDTELQEIGKVLEKHDPSTVGLKGGLVRPVMDVASYYQLALGVERLRAPEVLFQPSILGIDQSGLSDCLEYMLNYYPQDLQQRLAQNVFVTGGAAQFHNFDSRVEADLCSVRPFQSHLRVVSAGDKLLDAWRGGASWSCDPRNKGSFVSREEYLEKGAEHFKEHSYSNIRTLV